MTHDREKIIDDRGKMTHDREKIIDDQGKMTHDQVGMSFSLVLSDLRAGMIVLAKATSHYLTGSMSPQAVVDYSLSDGLISHRVDAADNQI